MAAALPAGPGRRVELSRCKQLRERMCSDVLPKQLREVIKAQLEAQFRDSLEVGMLRQSSCCVQRVLSHFYGSRSKVTDKDCSVWSGSPDALRRLVKGPKRCYHRRKIGLSELEARPSVVIKRVDRSGVNQLQPPLVKEHEVEGPR